MLCVRFLLFLSLVFVCASDPGAGEIVTNAPLGSDDAEDEVGSFNHVRRHNGTNIQAHHFQVSHVRVPKFDGFDQSRVWSDGISWVGTWRELEWTIIHLIGLLFSVVCMRYYAIGQSPVVFVCIVCANIAFVDPNVTKIDWILDMGVTLSVLTFFWYKFRKYHLKRIQRSQLQGLSQSWLMKQVDAMGVLRHVVSIFGVGGKGYQSGTMNPSHPDVLSDDGRLHHNGSVVNPSKMHHQVRSSGSSSEDFIAEDCTSGSYRGGSAWIAPSPLRSGQRHHPEHIVASSLPRGSKGGRPFFSKETQSEQSGRNINRMPGHRSAPDRKSASDDIRKYRHIIESCIRSRQLTEAEECLGTMQKLNLHCASSCLMLSDAYLQVKDFERALHWLDAAKEADGQVNLQPYNTLLDACAKSGALEFAESVINHMSTLGIRPDAVSYNSVIDACSKAKQVSKAVDWVRRMKASGVQPDVVSFSAVLNAYAQCGLYIQANEWLQKMEAGEEDVHPNVFSYNTCINAQVRSGQTVDPDQWTARMRKHGVQPNVVTYTTLCQPAASRGDFAVVERLMSYITEENLPVNHYCLAVLLNAYANAQPRQCDRAEAAFIDAVKRGLPINGTALRSLQRCLTRGRFVTLCSCHGVDYERLMNESQRTQRDRERRH